MAYANVAVRSRKVADAVDVQLPLAIAQGADLVSVLIGANDLVGFRADAAGLAARLGGRGHRGAGDPELTCCS